MIATRKRRSRSLAEIRRRRRRRRLLQMWCSRLIVLFIIIIIVLFFAFIFTMFKSSGKETSSYSNKVIEAEPNPIAITTYTAVDKEAIEVVLDDSEETIPIIISKAEVVPTAEPTPEPRISAYEPGEVYYYQFTYEEKLYIAKVVYAEARGEIFEGQVAVAAVVINRFFSDDPYFDNSSIESIVLQETQFAPIDDVTEEKLNNCPSCMEAVEAACKGYDPTRKMFDDGAKYFFDPQGITSEYQLRIRKDIEELVIGKHHFHNEFNEEEVRKGK